MYTHICIHTHVQILRWRRAKSIGPNLFFLNFNNFTANPCWVATIGHSDEVCLRIWAEYDDTKSPVEAVLLKPLREKEKPMENELTIKINIKLNWEFMNKLIRLISYFSSSKMRARDGNSCLEAFRVLFWFQVTGSSRIEGKKVTGVTGRIWTKKR